MMRILVIGGTGFIGPHVVSALVAGGHSVTVFHRGKTPLQPTAGVAEILCPQRSLADRGAYPEFQDRFRELSPDVVLDMIPTTETSARTLVSTFRGVARRVVAISSQDVYRAYGLLLGIEQGDPQPVPLDEEAELRQRLYPYRGSTPRVADDPRHWMDDYEKILVERTILSAAELPGTVLRLPMVYGPRDRQHRLFEYLKPMLDRRPAILLAEEMATWRWTSGYVENVAHAITLAVLDERARGRVYNTGEEDTLPLRDWVRAIGQAADWDGEIVTLPARRLPEALQPAVAVQQDLVVDTARIRRELGFSEPVSRAEALRRTVAWERENPPPQIDERRFDYAAEDEILAARKREAG